LRRRTRVYSNRKGPDKKRNRTSACGRPVEASVSKTGGEGRKLTQKKNIREREGGTPKQQGTSCEKKTKVQWGKSKLNRGNGKGNRKWQPERPTAEEIVIPSKGSNKVWGCRIFKKYRGCKHTGAAIQKFFSKDKRKKAKKAEMACSSERVAFGGSTT